LHYDFKEKLVNHFRGREGILDKIQKYIDGDQTNKVLALIGESGSGKSSVMAKITDAFIEKEKDKNTVVAYRFLGTSSNSSNVISMMQSVAGQIVRKYNVELKDLTMDGDEKGLYEIYGMSEVFKKCLALATPDKPVVVFLDALDQLSDTDNALQLHWLPQELPPNVKLVVSSLPELESGLSETQKIELPLLPGKEVNDILKTWLGSGSRRLTDKQFDEITGKEVSKLPIYLRIAFEQAKHWKSYHKYELSNSVDGIIKDFINRLESEHVNGLVEHVICYMLCGRYQGLAENEILDILVFDNEFWEAFLQHTHKDHLEELKAAKKIPVAVWSRLYLDLEPFLTERDADGVPIITFFHRQFNEVLEDKYKI
jgi:NACHT domain- and WD repeat-containing protein